MRYKKEKRILKASGLRCTPKNIRITRSIMRSNARARKKYHY